MGQKYSKTKRSPDYFLIVLFVFLIVAGLMTINSAVGDYDAEHSDYFNRQLLWAALSAAVFITAMLLPPKFYFAVAYILYAVSLALLIFILAVNRGPEPARWFNLGFINFQPSEIAKLCTIIALSRFLFDKRRDILKFSVTLRSLLLIALPTILVMLEPDLGTSVVYLMIGLPILIFGGINLKHLFFMLMPIIILLASFNIIVTAAVIAAMTILFLYLKLGFLRISLLLILNIGIAFSGPKIWNSLHPYQQKRIVTFLNPESDPRGAGYQIIQSKVAVGSGGLWGKGYKQGTQSHLKFLPEGHTDFIFSVFSEEMGFAGALIILLAFYGICHRGLSAAVRHRNLFAGMVLAGISAHFAIHAGVNIGMALGLLPVTGLPLPFLSYGGSSLLINAALAGIMIGMGMRWREY